MQVAQRRFDTEIIQNSEASKKQKLRPSFVMNRRQISEMGSIYADKPMPKIVTDNSQKEFRYQED